MAYIEATHADAFLYSEFEVNVESFALSQVFRSRWPTVILDCSGRINWCLHRIKLMFRISDTATVYTLLRIDQSSNSQVLILKDC